MNDTYRWITYTGKPTAREMGAAFLGGGNGCRLIRSNGIMINPIRINKQIRNEQINVRTYDARARAREAAMIMKASFTITGAIKAQKGAC